MSTEIFEIKNIMVANIKNHSDMAFFGIVTLSGSNYETKNVSGIAHLSEHMAFKATSSRNWRQINEEFARLGCNNNAMTSNDEIMYYATSPKENISKVISLIMDMFFNSTYPEDEIEKERGVIMEEKKMYDDDHRAFFSSQIGNSFFTWNIGHETIGTTETILSISREQILNYLNAKISPPNVIFLCCGDVDSSDLKKYIEDNMPIHHNYINPKRIGINDFGGGGWTDFINKPDKIKLVIERESTSQAIIHMLTNNLSASDPLYHHANIIIEALGGGLYSLLASRIREELGLCYGVQCFSNFLSYPNIRTFNIYSSVAVENVNKFIEETEKVIQSVIKDGISKDIFECAKTDHLSSILRSTETSAGLAFYMASKLLCYKKGSIEETLAKIRAVELSECNELAKKMLTEQFNWCVMIPKGSKI